MAKDRRRRIKSEELHRKLEETVPVTADKDTIKTSIVLSRETAMLADQAQEILGELSLSALCRHLIKEYVPGIIQAGGFPARGSGEQHRVFLEADLVGVLTRIGRDLGLPPSSVAALMLSEALPTWTKKAAEARKRMNEASETLEEDASESERRTGESERRHK